MLIRFRACNYRSLKEEQEFSFQAGASEGAASTKEIALRRAAAIYGANASGKSNVLKALDFMKSAVRNSQKLWPPAGPLPREPFLLDPTAAREPSFFEAEFLLNGSHYRYGFTINDQEVLEERLDAFPEGKRRMWLRREGGNLNFGGELTGDLEAIQRLTRPNSLFLSAAAASKHPALLPLYQWFALRLRYLPFDRRRLLQKAATLARKDTWKASLVALLRAADPSIRGLKVREENLLAPLDQLQDPQNKELAGNLIGALRKLLAAAKEEDPQSAEAWEKKPVLALLHQGAEAEVALEEVQESEGTLAFLALLVPVLETVQTGGTLCVDELAAGLHPLLALRMIRLFSNPKVSGRGAQIVFTTHDTSLLAAAGLRRDQIWFTEKDAHGRSHLYTLSDFSPVRDEKLPRGYLPGRYGPIPFWGWERFFARLDERGKR